MQINIYVEDILWQWYYQTICTIVKYEILLNDTIKLFYHSYLCKKS